MSGYCGVFCMRVGDGLFVDREEELKFLKKQYDSFMRGGVVGVIVYGVRRVGKTRLVEEFIRDKPHVVINCAYISSARHFYIRMIIECKETFELSDDWMGKKLNLLSLGIPEKEVFIEALKAPILIAEQVGQNIIVFLDEIHVFLDKLANRIAKEERSSKRRALLDLLWALKSVTERGRVFWILSSSLGWEKIREIMQRHTKEYPLLGLFERLEVKPLSKEHSIELAIKHNSDITYDQALSIAEISGGIPRIVITLATHTTRDESIVNMALRLLNAGEFDDFFENIIRLVDEAIPYDYPLIISVLLSIAEGRDTAKDIAERLKINPRVIRGVLGELHKVGIVSRSEEKPAKYKISYPLLSAWLLIRESWRAYEKLDLLKKTLDLLGLTMESYIREILHEAKRSGIEIYDDKHGTYLCGTTKKLSIRPEKVLSKKETEEFLARLDIRNADIIAREKEEYMVIEVKSGISDLEANDIAKLIRVASIIREKTHTKTKAILIYMGHGNIKPRAIAEALKNGVIIVSREGIKLIAKKLGIPKV